MANGTTKAVIVGTPKQEKLAKLLSENLRSKKPKTKGQLMRDSGYSLEQSKKPAEIIETNGFQKILEKYLPDKMILRKHKQLFGASRLDKFIFPNAVSDKEIRETINGVKGAKLIKIVRNPQWARAYYTVPDNLTQTKVLELAYKVKKKLGGDTDPNGEQPEEIREVILRVRKILPPAGR